MNHAILEHKLIVPAHLVPHNAFDAFKISLKNDDGEDVEYAFYNIDHRNGLVYFDRGDLSTIYRVFSHCTIEDRRSAPVMSSSMTMTEHGLGLIFTGKLKDNQAPVVELLSSEQATYGQLKAHPRFGKTVVMVAVTCRLRLKTLFLSHQIDLANQAYERFVQMTNLTDLEYELGKQIVGVVEDWEDLERFDVAIMPYQKFVSGKNAEEMIKKYRNQFGLIFVDECFHYDTLITLESGEKVPIGKVVDGLLIGEKYRVRAYNPQDERWECKEIVGYHKSRNEDGWLRINLGGSSGVLCTPNHSWYRDGYIKTEARDLKVGDLIMVYPADDSRISYPPALGDWQRQLIYGGLLADLHMSTTDNRARVIIVQGVEQESYFRYKKTIFGKLLEAKHYVGNSDHILNANTLSSVDIKAIYDKWVSNPVDILNAMDDRGWAFAFMDNGSYSDSSARLHINRQDWDTAELICKVFNERFGKASLKDYNGPTLTIPMETFRVFSEKIRRYVPDELRYKTPFGNDEFIEGFDDSKNHSLEVVTAISEEVVSGKSPYRYNISVKDHHNYLVGSAGFLVANCHKARAETYSATITSFNSKYRYGVSGTTELKHDKHLLHHHVIGPVIVEGHGDQLPCTVNTYNTGINVPLRPGKMFFTLALNYLSKHEARNAFMLSVIKVYLEAGHTIVAVSDRTGHCDWFAEQVRKLGYTSESYHAKRFKNKDQREEMLDRVRSGKTQAMFAMRSMVLGLDIPRALSFFNLLPTAHPQNYFQEFSRVRTPYIDAETGFTKTMGFIVDFRDSNHILRACYKTRRKEYMANNFVIHDDLSDEQK